LRQLFPSADDNHGLVPFVGNKKGPPDRSVGLGLMMEVGAVTPVGPGRREGQRAAASAADGGRDAERRTDPAWHAGPPRGRCAGVSPKGGRGNSVRGWGLKGMTQEQLALECGMERLAEALGIEP